MLNIVLLEPEIPQNTGNISRTCAATACTLHLIGPLGFEISDRYLKRAGLDYWQYLKLHMYENYEHFKAAHPLIRPYMASTKAAKLYSEVQYQQGDFIMFGKETKGLPEPLIEADYERAIRIPMLPEARSLNLSNSVAVVAYEALRQHDFPTMKVQGEIPK